MSVYSLKDQCPGYTSIWWKPLLLLPEDKSNDGITKWCISSVPCSKIRLRKHKLNKIIYLSIKSHIFLTLSEQKPSWNKTKAHFTVQNSQSCRAHWNSPSPVLQCNPGGSLDSRALCPRDNDTYWGISACHACLMHLWCFPCRTQEHKFFWITALFLISHTWSLVYMCVGVCVEALYLSTLNLGKWIEFLMNTVKLMASTNAGSLLQTQHKDSVWILPSNSSITV